MTLSPHPISNEKHPDTAVAVSVLLGRVAVELAGIAVSASSVQNALGKTMDQVSDLCDVPIVEFQALDRMQQKLEDLSKLALLLSDATANTRSTTSVTSSQLQATLLLTSLRERLQGNDSEVFEVRESPNDNNLTLF